MWVHMYEEMYFSLIILTSPVKFDQYKVLRSYSLCQALADDSNISSLVTLTLWPWDDPKWGNDILQS